jgi:hypothetical protein
MLVHLGGRERTQSEYQSLLVRTGYTLDRVTTLPSGQSLLEARHIPNLTAGRTPFITRDVPRLGRAARGRTRSTTARKVVLAHFRDGML